MSDTLTEKDLAAVFDAFNRHDVVLTPFRRLGQRIMYHWYYIFDERL